MVELIVKRVQYADCVQNGYLLEDFPKTAEQSLMLSESGIIPDFIFYLNMYSEYCYSRVEDLSNDEFMYDTRVFSERLTIHLRENPGVMAYYEKHFGNIKYINGLKSKWYVEDTIVDHIKDSIASKSQFAKNILDDSEACSLENINIDRELYNLCHSAFGYYCPTTWKNHQLFENCKHKEETVVLFKHPNSSMQNLYFFRNTEQRDVFIKSPTMFSDHMLFPTTAEIPKLIHPHNAAQIVTTEKNLANYCPVTLHEEDKVTKGYLLFLVFHKDNKFVFESLAKMVRFLASPKRYSKVTLPVKMPPINEKITLLNFPELEDSVPFLEQSIGSIATRGLLEVTSFMTQECKHCKGGENSQGSKCQHFKLKYPTMSIRETALKLFAMFLKTNNPSNTPYAKKKYQKKIRTFVDR